MPYVNGRRVAIAPEAQRQLQHAPFVAPTGGWVSAVNQAAAVPGTALVCENWFPTTRGIRLRGGSQVFADIGTESAESFISYIGATTQKLFAAIDGEIYEITEGSPPTSVVTGQTSNYYSYSNFATVGGYFISAVNGTDPLQLYDGTTWTAITGASTPAITGIDTSLLSHVNVYRNRQWFVEKDSLRVHYLPVDSIAGAVGTLSLAGVFKRGGSVLFTATWSADSGAGMDDRLVIMSTQGEIAVYEGSNPSDIADFGLVQVYDASPPLGKNGYVQVGGDLLILTDIGIIPMSAIQVKTPEALALASATRQIQPDWTNDVRTRRNPLAPLPWEVVKWPSRNMAFVSSPTTDIDARWCYVVNLETGAWAKYTGWDARSFVLYEDRIFFGTSEGKVMEAEITGNDNGQLIYHTYVGHAEHLGAVGRYKTVMQARARFRVSYNIAPKLSISTNYSITLPSPPSVGPISMAADVWDAAIWDTARWDNGQSLYTQTVGWTSIGKSGDVHSLQIQATSGQVATPMAEMILMEVTYEGGGFVV